MDPVRSRDRLLQNLTGVRKVEFNNVKQSRSYLYDRDLLLMG